MLPNRHTYVVGMAKLSKGISFGKADIVLVDNDACSDEELEDIIMDNYESSSKVIVLVSSISIEKVRRLSELSVGHIIKKPFNMQLLNEKIEKVLK